MQLENIYKLLDEIDDDASIGKSTTKSRKMNEHYKLLTEDAEDEVQSAENNSSDAHEPEENTSASSPEPENVVDKLKSADKYESFVEILDSDGKSKAFLNYLRDHYKLGDDSIGTIKKANPSETTIQCYKLMPTQQNISIKKSLGMIESGDGWAVKIINNPTEAFTTPTVTYAGKYIIDGHHRWSKVLALNGPQEQIKVLNFPEIEGITWEDMLKAVELAIVTAVPNAKLKQAVGDDNMLTPDGARVAMEYYANHAAEDVVAAMKAKNRGSDRAQQAKVVGINIAKTMKVVRPVQGAARREYMPQMDDANLAKNLITKTGVVDMSENLENN